ncbi:MAG: hypothetical protein HY271_18535 [Deltaproteobacteria bacterium]|nr:hypothetical protein [Deltaproteobacteria bacterium]
MKTAVALVTLMLVAVPLAGRAFAKKHDEFELKELHEQREEHVEDKAVRKEEEREEDQEKTQARVHPKPHPQQRHGLADDAAGDSDAD